MTQAIRTWRGAPLVFEANRGQAEKGYGYLAHGPGYALGITSTGIALVLHRPEPGPEAVPARPDETQQLLSPGAGAASLVEMQLEGSNPEASISGIDAQPGSSNYFIGRDPSKWRRSIPHFNRVKIGDVWPGIDLVFYGSGQQLEYDFAVRARADAGLIRLRTQGAQSVGLDEQGNAILATPAGEVTLRRPVAYQEMKGVRTNVESRFRLRRGRLSIAVGKYDHRRELIVDPVLDYAVSLGGSNGNWGMGLAVDVEGDTYLTGHTCSADFPSTTGNFQTIHTNPSANNCQDAFVLKLDPIASTLIYSDYIGGTGGYQHRVSPRD